MNSESVEKIATAVLYEGYMLYPYRRSAVKNRQRFNFGVLYPRDYCEEQANADTWWMQTECLARGNSQTTLEVKVRFLQLGERQDWSEGHERDFVVKTGLESTIPIVRPFAFAAAVTSEGGRLEAIAGELEMTATPLAEGLYKITAAVRNTGTLGTQEPSRLRDEALLRSLVSVHTILHLENGELVSGFDPPEALLEATSSCHNVGTWPVLVGEEPQRDTMLSAPIILYDYPKIAPESPGDLFDGTEIDEILALRILTLTDDEKQEMRNSDDRARQILERTETTPPEHFQKLHGALRGLRPPGESQ